MSSIGPARGGPLSFVIVVLRFWMMLGVSCALAACTGGDGAPRSDGGPGTNDAAVPTAVLTFETEPLTLEFGAASDIVVRYTEADGTPIEGGRVRFVLEGTAHDSTAQPSEATADRDGLVLGRVLAGHTVAAFRVRASAERAAPAYLDVSVSDRGFGALHVQVRHDGTRRLSDQVVEVFADRTCREDSLTPGTGDRVMRMGLDRDEAWFRGLPAGIDYAIVGRGEGPTGQALASGCVDGVVVVADRETDATVVITDLELVPEGQFATQVVIAPTTSADRAGDALRTASEAHITAAGGDAALLLQGIEQALRARGDIAAAEAFRIERSSGDTEASLSNALSAAGRGPTIAFGALADRLLLRLQEVAVGGNMFIGDTIAWETTVVTTGSGDTSAPRLAIDLAARGVDPVATIDATVLPSEDAIAITDLTFTLPLGTVALATLDALVAATGATSIAEMVAEDAGCTELVDWGMTRTTLATSCDASCLLDACKATLERTVTAIEASASVLDGERPHVSLSGSGRLEDSDGDRRVDALSAPELAGVWSDPTGTTGDEVQARLSAARVVEVP